MMIDADLPLAGDCRVRKHSLVIAGHRTSVSLEDAFWQALGDLATARQMSVAALVAQIDANRGEANLSSAIRVTVLQTLRTTPGLGLVGS